MRLHKKRTITLCCTLTTLFHLLTIAPPWTGYASVPRWSCRLPDPTAAALPSADIGRCGRVRGDGGGGVKPGMLPVTGVLAAMLGAGIALGVIALWEPWHEDGTLGVAPASSPQLVAPTATPYVRRLTPAEAAARVLRDKNTEAFQPQNQVQISENVYAVERFENCEGVDFNEFKKSWVVECAVSLISLVTDQPVADGHVGTLAGR